MSRLAILISVVVAYSFLCPEEFIACSRRIRHWLRDDIRRRLSDKEWQAIQDELADF